MGEPLRFKEYREQCEMRCKTFEECGKRAMLKRYDGKSNLHLLNMNIIMHILSFLKFSPVTERWRYFERQFRVDEQDPERLLPLYTENSRWSMPVCPSLPDNWVDSWHPGMPYEARPAPPEITCILRMNQERRLFTDGHRVYHVATVHESRRLDGGWYTGGITATLSNELIQERPFVITFTAHHLNFGLMESPPLVLEPNYWRLEVRTVDMRHRAIITAQVVMGEQV